MYWVAQLAAYLRLGASAIHRPARHVVHQRTPCLCSALVQQDYTTCGVFTRCMSILCNSGQYHTQPGYPYVVCVSCCNNGQPHNPGLVACSVSILLQRWTTSHLRLHIILCAYPAAAVGNDTAQAVRPVVCMSCCNSGHGKPAKKLYSNAYLAGKAPW